MEFNFNSLEKFYNELIAVLPSILGFILFVILAWVVYTIIIFAVKKLLKFSRLEKLNQLINENEFVQGTPVKVNLNKVILSTIKFILLLIIVFVGADILNLTIVSEQLGKLFDYLPKLLSAVLIFVVGVYVASQAKKIIQSLLKSVDSNGSKAIGAIVFYLIFIFVTITALNQAGVNTDIVSNNLTFILGAVFVAVAIAVGLGSKEIVRRLILGYYTKKNFQEGMKIQIDDTIGVISEIDNICLKLKTENETIVYPIEKISDSNVKILKSN